MDEQKVRSYLLRITSPSNNRTFGAHYKHFSRSGLFVVSLLWGAMLIVGVIANYANIITAMAFILLSLVNILMIFLAIRFIKRTVINWEAPEIVAECEKSTRRTVASTSIAVGGGLFGGQFLFGYLLADASMMTRDIVMLSLGGISLWVMTFVCTLYHYKCYLLKKCCPDLIDYKSGGS